MPAAQPTHAPPVTRRGSEAARNLRLGQHTCIIYDDPNELLDIAVGYLAGGLESGHQCIFIAHETHPDEIRRGLEECGVPCAAHEAAGDLQLVAKEDVYLRGGTFRPEAVTGFIQEATEGRPARYAGVRGMGEMAWAGDIPDGFRTLIEYESKVNVLFRTLPFAGLCAYPRSKFPAEVLTEILRVHPQVYYKGRLYENFFFVPPEEYLAQRKPEVELERLLENLEARRVLEDQQAQAEVRRRYQVELERLVAERTAELEATNRDLESFNLSVSHDVRAHLRGIASFCGMLAQQEGNRVSPQGQATLERILASCRDVSHVVDGLLRLAHLNRAALGVQAVDVTARATQRLERLARDEPGRTVSWTVEPNLKVHADPDLLDVVLDNVLSNAWKFTRRSPEARIEVRATPQGFAVHDNGVGFPNGAAEELFQPFRRLHGGRDFEGHGIGLATVKRVVERHGGTVTARGEPGHGATFTLAFPWPVAERAAAKLRAGTAPAEAPQRAVLTVP